MAGCGSSDVTSLPVNPSARPAPVSETKSQLVSQITTAALAHVQQRQQQERALLDPTQDGWPTEAFADDAKQRLESLLSVLVADRRPEEAKVVEYLVPDKQVKRCRPELSAVYDDGTTRVLRPRSTDRDEMSLFAALVELLRPLQDVGPPQCHVKVVQVDLSGPQAETVVLYDANATNKTRSIQQTARLKCRWAASDLRNPQLIDVTCEDFEEVHVELVGGRWFADGTQTVLGGDPLHFRTEQLGYGLNHWMQRVERAHHMDDSVRNGLAIGDANRRQVRTMSTVAKGPDCPIDYSFTMSTAQSSTRRLLEAWTG